MNMKKKLRIIGSVMLIVALTFVWFAMNHPELSWPWGKTVSLTLYGIYLVVMVILLIAPCKEKG